MRSNRLHVRIAGSIALTPGCRRLRRIGGAALAIAFCLAPPPVLAVAVITITDPWVRVAPNARSAEAYMVVRSSEGGAIVGVRTDIDPGVAMQSPGSKRALVERIPLPPGTSVKLAPGAYRFVLPKLGRSLKLGDRVAFDLVFETSEGKRQEIPVSAEVRRRSAYEDHLLPHKHEH
jgi:copper(I)-binding protein